MTVFKALPMSIVDNGCGGCQSCLLQATRSVACWTRRAVALGETDRRINKDDLRIGRG